MGANAEDQRCHDCGKPLSTTADSEKSQLGAGAGLGFPRFSRGRGNGRSLDFFYAETSCPNEWVGLRRDL